MQRNSDIRSQILAALSHPEAEEGLYFDNLTDLHEDEERPPVLGEQVQILDSLKELIGEGLVEADDSGEKIVFRLVGAPR